MTAPKPKAVAYFRTSSATNVGDDKDSLRRQREAVRSYAKSAGLVIDQEFYDAAVSGSDPIDTRPGFCELLKHVRDDGISVVLVEDATRFARDLAVQITGHQLLRSLDVELIPANSPEFFRDESPTAKMVRDILGAVAEFERATTVRKLKGARDRASEAAGRRIEGCRKDAATGEYQPKVSDKARELAKRLRRKNPHTGERRSYRQIAAMLAEKGFTRSDGSPYGAQSVKNMVM